MAKNRTRIPENVAAAVLVASAHTCCKCEERGKAIQIHHIDEDPSNHDPSNLAVLCFQCHHETQITGGFGRQLSAAEVRIYRDQWTERVQKRRQEADAIFIGRATSSISPAPRFEAPRGLAHMPSRSDLEKYIDDLPNILSDAYAAARAGWDSGVTADMRSATYSVIEVVQEMWLRLAQAFPPLHFGGSAAEQYMHQYVQQRYAWHYALAEPHGPGSGGTIAGLLAGGGVLRDLENAVVETVDALKGLGESQRARKIWLGYWEGAKEEA
jgi:hypothetical protein